MITVICATHRPQNQTLMVVEKYAGLLKKKGEKVKILQIAELPKEFLMEESFGEINPALEELLNEKITDARAFVIISPEYNGSFPGIFKTFLDVVNPAIWRGKKIALVGVATGRAGNLRGMDHLTDIFHHLRADVFSLKIPISSFNDLLDEGGDFTHSDTLGVLEKQASEFLDWI